ncbi:hydrogenase maturation protease [Halomonas denitrificans]|uniref:hydrogenase maturation protease n=1 Tax=Halomonas denitrificans TaxID=370769 RepID=UPI001300BD66|nr:hydrogenase maturation protease [Halomonas denitrificans]
MTEPGVTREESGERPAGRAHLVGLGSPHGGDRLGWLAVEALREALAGRDDINIDCLAQPVDLFLPRVASSERVLLIDAMRGRGPPGTLEAFAPGELPETAALACLSSLSSHGLDLAGTLALAETLGLFPGGIRILGIEMPAEIPKEADPEMPEPCLNEATRRRLHAAVLGWLDGDAHRDIGPRWPAGPGVP